ncbi:hypothetical protein QE152_g14070 [Popillia japonica]|uniref:Uncharacterized protein n=1 Tax=Popillia japonica TaxID=7064 RepID=A0AAW1LC42_POPJA
MGALCRLMPRLGGPSEGSRSLLCATAESVVLYAASIWREAIRREVHRKKLLSVQRKTAICIARAYLGALCRLMPRLGGPSEGSRSLLCATAESVVLYAASAVSTDAKTWRPQRRQQEPAVCHGRVGRALCSVHLEGGHTKRGTP